MDFTHEASRRSWIISAQGHPDFPLQNLPFGVFQPRGGRPRIGMAIGDAILDIAAASSFFDDEARKAAQECYADDMAGLMKLGAAARVALRKAASELLDAESDLGKRAQSAATTLVHSQQDCSLLLPTRIGNYTDFFAGIQHAINAGKLFRPDAPLLPNYDYVPVGYHGRASTVAASGTPVRRPNGQFSRQHAAAPVFGPTERLDYEVELAMWIGHGNTVGEPVRIEHAGDAIWGFGLLNDWSARDIQAWEYQPLGPFLSKSFGTTVSPWIVTPEALEPFRGPLEIDRRNDPKLLPHLSDSRDLDSGGLDVEIEAFLSSELMRQRRMNPVRMSSVNARHLYWTFAQLVAHHTSNGCALGIGDLFGSGTISGSARESFGSLLEMTSGGKNGLALPTDEVRTFLADGDEVILRAHCSRDGFVRIGFGECRALIKPAVALNPA